MINPFAEVVEFIELVADPSPDPPAHWLYGPAGPSVVHSKLISISSQGAPSSRAPLSKVQSLQLSTLQS
jgi:hypothetical protein